MWIILLLALWQLIYISGRFSPLIFPSLITIAKELYVSMISGEIVGQTIYSLMIISVGLIIGILGAVILSTLSIVSKICESLVDTITVVLHPLPGVALLPLIIIWFGTGLPAIIFIIVHSVLWPMQLNMTAGFRAVPKTYMEVGRNFGLKKPGIILHIMLPAAFSYIFAGIKIAWARSWRALISAEMIFGAMGGAGGLGWYIFKKRVFMDTPGIFAGLLIIVLIGILVEELIFNKIETATVKKWGISYDEIR